MIENSPILAFISERYKEIIKNYSNYSVELNDSIKYFGHIYIEDTKKELIISRILVSDFEDDCDKFMLMALDSLLRGKNLNYLVNLTFRELDSYLSDQNTRSAFTDSLELWEKAFKKQKMLLYSDCLQIFISKLSLDYGLVELNRCLQEAFNEFSQRLVFADFEKIVIEFSPKTNDRDGLLETLQSVLGEIHKLKHVKVIAV